MQKENFNKTYSRRVKQTLLFSAQNYKRLLSCSHPIVIKADLTRALNFHLSVPVHISFFCFKRRRKFYHHYSSIAHKSHKVFNSLNCGPFLLFFATRPGSYLAKSTKGRSMNRIFCAKSKS